MLPVQVRVDLGVVARKGYPVFSKAPASLEPHNCLASYPGHLFWGVLLLCRGAVGIFYNPSQLCKGYEGRGAQQVKITPSIMSFGSLVSWVECSPMVGETSVQSQVESYQRLKKWYLMPPCLKLSIIRWGSRVKWSNPGNGVVPSSTPWVVAIENGAFGSLSTKVANLLSIIISL